MCVHTNTHALIQAPWFTDNDSSRLAQELPSHLESSTVSEHFFQFPKQAQIWLSVFIYIIYYRPWLIIKENQASWCLAWIMRTSRSLKYLLFSHPSLEIRSFLIKSHSSFLNSFLHSLSCCIQSGLLAFAPCPKCHPLFQHQGLPRIPQHQWNWQRYSEDSCCKWSLSSELLKPFSKNCLKTHIDLNKWHRCLHCYHPSPPLFSSEISFWCTFLTGTSYSLRQLRLLPQDSLPPSVFFLFLVLLASGPISTLAFIKQM